MSRLSALATALAVTLGWSGTAAAGPMLTGSVSYDRSAGLYTYTYTLDDRTAPAGVDLVLIRVATHVYDLFHLNPVSGTGPSPFNYFNVYEGGNLDAAGFPSGTFYGWDAWRARPLTPGVHSGLSFVSRYGPGMDESPNYVLYSHELYSGVVDYGRVVAPDLTNAPEPGAFVLGIVGLVVIGAKRLRNGVRAVLPTDTHV